MADLTVSIVNWNTREDLSDCLKAVLAQQGLSCEIIVVDNASSDCSAEMVRSVFADKVQLISNEDNRGFGAAHNQAIGCSSGKYIVLLNPDTLLLEEDALARMTGYMDANPDIGVIGPLIENVNGTLQYSARRFPSMAAGLFRQTLLGKFFPNNRHVKQYLMTDWQHDRIADVDWLSGAALMIRRETVDAIGVLDERFFMYCEDVDLCKRAHIGGWRVVYFPEVRVRHRIGSASDRNPVEMIRQHHASMLKYFVKYDGHTPRVLLTPFVFLGLWLRSRTLIRKAKRTLLPHA